MMNLLQIDHEDKTVTGVSDKSIKTITIPEGVRYINNGAFRHCHALESIIIPESVCFIGDNAFKGCSALKSIHIPDSVETIGNNTFERCTALRSVRLPQGLKEIMSYAFEGCISLESITFPDSLKIIMEGAFCDCSALSSINIPKELDYIDCGVFQGCSSLSEITVSPDNPVFDSRDNCNAIIETGTNTLILGCKNTVIPYCLTSICAYAFERIQDLTSIVIPDGVEHIGKEAFAGCKGLVSITIPQSMKSIEDGAFEDCSGLTSIVIPDGVEHIGKYAFAGCSLKSVFIPRSVRHIDSNALYCCPVLSAISVSPDNPVYDSRDNCNAIIETETDTLLKGCLSTIIPNDMRWIGDYAFYGYSTLKSISIPDGLTGIGKWAFCGSGLATIFIPRSVIMIDQSAFNGCSHLSSIMISSDNPSYDSRDNCNAIIESGTNTLIIGCNNTIIPKSVTTIHRYAFSYSGLKSIVIPDSVEKIERKAFFKCNNLASIIVEPDNPFYDSRDNCNAIIETGTNTLIIGCKNTIIPNSVRCIGSASFAGCNNLSSIAIPDSVRKIDDKAFFMCKGLTSLLLGENSIEFGQKSFAGCSALKEISIHVKDVRTIKLHMPDFLGLDINKCVLIIPEGAEDSYHVHPFFSLFNNLRYSHP